MDTSADTMRVKAYRALAVCDDESTCGFCGKTDLQRVIAFEEIETGEVIYAGTTCAETVKLLIVDESEESGEAKPRKARQIVSMLERKARETALAASLELAGWTVAALVIAWNGDALPCSRGERLPCGLEVPVPQGSSVRQNAIARLIYAWVRKLAKIEARASLARKEELALELHSWIEAHRQAVAGQLYHTSHW